MAAVLLFVTADVPIDVSTCSYVNSIGVRIEHNKRKQMINEVLRLGCIEYSNSCFNLISSPEQELRERRTNPPVEDFKTGFSSRSVKDLGEYMQARHAERKDREGSLYDLTTIAVLDARSKQDRTLNLGKFTSERREVPEDPDYGSPPAWLSVRLKFESIPVMVRSATFKDFVLFGEDSIGLVNEVDVYVGPS
ncbi:hypothetical protein PMZ80_010045 [Knufia obscura]|uniref:Uncharacterized protein n=1 Tax=Knufia obscura TaxID=1635080 RepID=A0ABR0RBA1_9EURO|nr:hypothetical protein PMZ80_010045 [Knufia obscura]